MKGVHVSLSVGRFILTYSHYVTFEPTLLRFTRKREENNCSKYVREECIHVHSHTVIFVKHASVALNIAMGGGGNKDFHKSQL